MKTQSRCPCARAEYQRTGWAKVIVKRMCLNAVPHVLQF